LATAPADSVARFAKLASQLAEGDESKLSHREGFGTHSLFIGKKMFAVLDESGALVVKLPAARVVERIADGTGYGWHPGTGKPLKEYLAFGMDQQAKWLRLAKEAREFMRAPR
jgi:hypothetical protein